MPIYSQHAVYGSIWTTAAEMSRSNSDRCVAIRPSNIYYLAQQVCQSLVSNITKIKWAYFVKFKLFYKKKKKNNL